MLDASRPQHEEQSEEVPDQTSIATPPEEIDDSVAADQNCDTTEHDEEAARIEEPVRIAREKIARLPSDLHPGGSNRPSCNFHGVSVLRCTPCRPYP